MFHLAELPAGLRAQLRGGHVVPFLGAGLSVPCGLPNWRGLLERLLAWGQKGGFVPAAEQITHSITEGDFDAAAHALSQFLGKRLTDALREILDPPGLRPTTLHELLASVEWPIVLTTNLDNLLPESFAQRLDPLTWRDNQRMGEAIRTSKRHLMLVHGWIKQPDSIVLTPATYRESFRSPAQRLYLRTLLSRYTILFVGCSLRDPDIRYFLEEVRHAFGTQTTPHYALLPNDEGDEIHRVHLRDSYAVHALTYTPSPGHPEVETVLRRIIDVIPAEHLHDPRIKSAGLQAAKLAFAAMAPDDYLRLFADTCDTVAASGFRRTAWTALSDELRQPTGATPEARLRAVTQLVSMMREDHSFGRAMQAVKEQLTLLDHPTVPASLRDDALRSTFTSFLDEYCLQDAEHIYQRAVQQGSFTAQDMRSALRTARFLNSGQPVANEEGGLTPTLVECELMARRGGIDDALSRLAALASGKHELGDIGGAVQVHNKCAELLYLACRNEEAWSIFENAIIPHEQALTIEDRASLQHNQFLAGFAIGKHVPIQEFYANWDAREQTGAAARAEQLLTAESASRKRQHYNSLPPLWRDLRQAAEGLSWGARVRAHDRLAWEVLAAGWLSETAHHAIIGDNEQCLGQLAGLLTARGDRNLTRAVVEYILTNCRLTRHVKTASTFLSGIGDILPDELMPDVSAWLADAAMAPPTNTDAEQCTIPAWDALAALTYRLTEEHCNDLLHRVQGHPVLAVQRYQRAKVLKTIRALAKRATLHPWTDLAQKLLPIATSPWDFDYAEAIEALASTAEKAPEARTLIRNALFEPGRKIPVQLARYANTFGYEIEIKNLNRSLAAVAEHLHAQVRLEDNTSPPFGLSTFGTYQTDTPSGRVVLQTYGGGEELDFIAMHQGRVSDDALAQVIEVVLALVAHPLNNRVNRIMLMTFLYNIQTRLSVSQMHAAGHTLRLLVTGEAVDSPTEYPNTTTTDRLHVNAPAKTEEQATALRTLVALARHHPPDPAMEIPALVQNALFHAHPVIRQCACAAAAEMPVHCPELELPLLTAALDSERPVAGAALNAATRLIAAGRLQAHVPMLVTIAARMSIVDEASVRALAARLTRALSNLPLKPHQVDILARTRQALETDTSYQVREAGHG